MEAHPPVARVCIDSPLPHLDRPFDYHVPPALEGVVGPGTRVRVPFAGRLVSGVVVELVGASEFAGRLAHIKSAGAGPSFNEGGLDLALAIARRYGGSFWDVTRLMAPPRVASVEKRAWPVGVPGDEVYADALSGLAAAWDQYGGLPGDLAAGGRYVWEALPEAPERPLPAHALLAAACASVQGGGSAIVVVPDLRALDALCAAAEAVGLSVWAARKPGPVARVHAADKPSPRYGSYLAGLHGDARIVVGTRPAAMANVPRLKMIAVWDDGNSGYEERHAPYPHARTVAAMRAESEGAALLIGGFAQTVAARALVEHGWAKALSGSRGAVRDAVAAVTLVTDDDREREGGAGWHWMPGSAWRRVIKALGDGPALVLVPRAGYVRAAACATCREWAVCRTCEGPLELPSSAVDPSCTQCGTVNQDWHCASCGGAKIAHVRIGVEKVAEELAAMAQGATVTLSAGATGVVPDGEVRGGLVVATPAAVPAVAGGYAHAVVVDASALVGQDADGDEDAIRLILNALAYVRPRGDGGGATVVGRLPDEVARAVSTWAPAAAAAALYAERGEIQLPPHRRVVELRAPATVLGRAFSITVDNHPLGSHPAVDVVLRDGDRAVLLCTRSAAQGVVDVLRALQRELSEAGEGELRMRVDGPLRLG